MGCNSRCTLLIWLIHLTNYVLQVNCNRTPEMRCGRFMDWSLCFVTFCSVILPKIIMRIVILEAYDAGDNTVNTSDACFLVHPQTRSVLWVEDWVLAWFKCDAKIIFSTRLWNQSAMTSLRSFARKTQRSTPLRSRLMLSFLVLQLNSMWPFSKRFPH